MDKNIIHQGSLDITKNEFYQINSEKEESLIYD